jgi:hypothetical protein
MEESDIMAPLYYILGRDMSKEDLEAAHWVFNITPCATGVVSRHTDKSLVDPIVYEVLKAEDEQACNELAAHLARATNRPMITVGEGNQLTAVYHSGVVETICLFKPTSMS